jgi:hypothetical protein
VELPRAVRTGRQEDEMSNSAVVCSKIRLVSESWQVKTSRLQLGEAVRRPQARLNELVNRNPRRISMCRQTTHFAILLSLFESRECVTE